MTMVEDIPMANETPKDVQTESPSAPPVAPVAAQPTRSITASSVRKVQGKRGRPKKAETSLTRTTRRIARGKAVPRQKAASAAPRMTMLNRLLNFSVVIAVFVTAMAIQRIVPTGPVNAPKVEALPVPAAPSSAPAVAEPAPAEAPAAAPEAPKVSTTDCIPAATPAAKPAAAPRIARRTKTTAPRMTRTIQSHDTALNSGGAEDLDSEAARQAYMARSKLATRTPTQNK